MAYSGRALRDVETAGWEITETLHPEDSATGWHEHEAGHFCLVVAGGLVDEGGDARRDCGPGALLYFPPGVPHRDRFPHRGARCLNLRPPGRPACGRDGQDEGVLHGHGRSPDPSERAGGPAGVYVCESRASWLASRVYDRIRLDAAVPRRSLPELGEFLEAARPKPLDPPPETDWLARARKLIEQSWTDGPRLGTIAGRVGVSRFHLARKFRERFGCSVGEYVHRLRVTRARHLLLHSDASLSHIAFATGFSDQSHFTRIFGRHVGTPPGRYRNAA